MMNKRGRVTTYYSGQSQSHTIGIRFRVLYNRTIPVRCTWTLIDIALRSFDITYAVGVSN